MEFCQRDESLITNFFRMQLFFWYGSLSHDSHRLTVYSFEIFKTRESCRYLPMKYIFTLTFLL